MDKILRYKRVITIILLMFITITSIPIDVIATNDDPYTDGEYMELVVGSIIDSLTSIKYHYNYSDEVSEVYAHEADKSTGIIEFGIRIPGYPDIYYKGHYTNQNVTAKLDKIIKDNGIQEIKDDLERAEEYQIRQKIEEDALKALGNRDGLEKLELGFEYDSSVDKYYLISEYDGVAVGKIEIQKQDLRTGGGAYNKHILELVASTISKMEELGSPLTEEEIIKIINSIVANSTASYNQQINVTIEKNNDGSITAIFEIDGNKIPKTFKVGMSKIEIEKEVSSAITELLQKLNTFIGELTGDFTGNVFGHSTIRQFRPFGLEGTGGIMTWIPDGKEKLYIRRFEIPGKKDMNGNPIEMVAYGHPFGGVKNGQHRFLGYCPKGYPLTNPFYPDDITSITPLWNRGQFKLPWDNKELKRRFETDSTARRYMVSLEEIERADGNKELNKLTWMGLKFHWSTHVSASDEFEPWHEVVKIQVPPTDDTWGMAYYPSKVNGGFRYVTIPIPPQSMLGIDIKTDTIISTPQIVTGNKVEIKTVYSIHNVKSAKDKEKFLNMDFDATVTSPLFGEKKYS